MSNYTEKIENHLVYSSLTDIQNEIMLVESVEEKAPLAVETLARIAFIVANFQKALEVNNKDLIAISWLDDVSRALNNIKSYLSSYKNNKDANALTNNCNSYLDTVLQATAKINCVKSMQSLRGITAAENEYKRIMDSNNSQLYSKIKDIEAVLDLLKNKIDENEKTSQQSISNIQQAINSEKQRLDAFGVNYQNQMAQDQKAFVTMSEQLKDSFVNSQDERKMLFDNQIKSIEEERSNQKEIAIKQTKEIQENASNLIDEYNQKFSDYQKQVENIVGIVNTNMFSHKYKEVADDAHNRARFWHGVAVVLMVIVSLFAVYAFIITVNKDTSWVKLIAKIFATTTLVTGAAYAARQASKQEKVERYARKIEMELVAIDPFISTLDDAKKATIKEEIARKIFGKSGEMGITSKDEAYTAMDKLTSIEDLLLTVIKNLGK